MKKTYQHPRIYVENTRLSLLTLTCAKNVNGTEAIAIPDGMEVWEKVFTDSNVDCFYKVNTPETLSDFFPDDETFCYNIPTNDSRLFAS